MSWRGSLGDESHLIWFFPGLVLKGMHRFMSLLEIAFFNGFKFVFSEGTLIIAQHKEFRPFEWFLNNLSLFNELLLGVSQHHLYSIRSCSECRAYMSEVTSILAYHLGNGGRYIWMSCWGRVLDLHLFVP